MYLRKYLPATLILTAALIGGCKRSSNDKEPAMATHTTPHLRWATWSDQAFARAAAEDKLVLVDSGATWCHWCHVMDRVTYEDPEVVDLLNDRFVAVRIDRDRLPAVDAALQRSVPLFHSRGGGWPLTVIMTPQGHVLFKATFLPPRAGGQFSASTGLIELLEAIDTDWRARRDEIDQAATALQANAAQHQESLYFLPGDVAPTIVSQVTAGVRKQIDPVHGGFGAEPKFFHVASLDLLARSAWQGDSHARDDLLKTLDAIARGGVHDHIGGGLHRYSVDERWHVPHFEKMAYDNAPLLALYANAYAATGQAEYADLARRTLEWIRRDLTDPDTGSFYASQDADVGLDDDGDFFTWTVDEVRNVLGDQADATIEYYGVDDVGDMHGRHGRNVLHTPKTLAQVAKLLDRDEQALAAELAESRQRLLAARRARTRPAVDQTVFADLNGMLIDAHLTAYERLGDDQALAAALRALDHALDGLRTDDGIFGHYRTTDGLRNVGLLTDQAWMLRALVHAYAIQQDARYLDAATNAADYILEHLANDDGAFVSSPPDPNGGPTAVDPTVSWEDSPSRSACSVAAEELVRLSYLAGEPRFAEAAAKALASFAGAAQDANWAAFIAGYANAVETYLNGPRVIIIAGPAAGAATAELTDAARQAYVPGGMVLQLDPSEPAQADLLARLGYPPADTPVAYVCRGSACLAPAATVAQLHQRLADLVHADAD